MPSTSDFTNYLDALQKYNAETNPYLPPKRLYESVTKSLEGALKGELPQDVVNQIQQRAAEFGVSSGLPGSQFAGYQGLRNLGLTSLERIKDAEKYITNTWMTPEQQAAKTLENLRSGLDMESRYNQLYQQNLANWRASNASWNQNKYPSGTTWNAPAGSNNYRTYSRTDFSGRPIYD